MNTLLSRFPLKLRLPAGVCCAMLLASSPVQANCVLRTGNLAATPDGELVDNNDGTISHGKTGLMWKKCVQGRTGATCASGTGSNFIWQAALRQGVLDNTATFTDWRLPSRNELYSIVETGCFSPSINVTRFPLTPASGLFWTSTHAGNTAPDSVWAIRFAAGTSQLTAKTSSALVRLVRSITPSDHGAWRIPSATNPAAFTFNTKFGVTDIELGTLIVSSPVTLSFSSGTHTATASGGDFDINNTGTWVTSGTVGNGSQVRMRVRAPGSRPGTASGTLTVNGRSGSFLVTTDAQDTVPNPLVFTNQTGVVRSSVVTSNPVSVTGTNSSASLSITGGTYEKNNSGSWVSAPGSVINGDSVRVRHTASTNWLTAVSTTLTIGGVEGGFSSTTQAQDLTPDVFGFVDQYDVTRSATITSAPVIVAGINDAATISVVGGTYDINGSNNFFSASGSVNNGDSVRVRHSAGVIYNSTVNSVLTIGGVADTFSSTTVLNPSDTTPDSFSFVDQTGVVRSTEIISDSIMVSGIGGAANIAITNGQYEKNSSGIWATGAGTVNNRDTVRVKHTSSANFSTAVNTSLTIAGVTDTFTTTTLAADTTPDAFTFLDQTDVALSSQITSAPVTISGINTGASISISGGTYDINESGTFVSAGGTVNPGDRVRVRHTASAANLTGVDTVLTIGGVSDTFTSTTVCGLSEWNAITFANTSSRYNSGYTCTRFPITLNRVCDGTSISDTGTRFVWSTDGVNFTSPATINRGQALTLRFTGGSGSSSSYSTTVTVGTMGKAWTHSTSGSTALCSPKGTFSENP